MSLYRGKTAICCAGVLWCLSTVPAHAFIPEMSFKLASKVTEVVNDVSEFTQSLTEAKQALAMKDAFGKITSAVGQVKGAVNQAKDAVDNVKNQVDSVQSQVTDGIDGIKSGETFTDLKNQAQSSVEDAVLGGLSEIPTNPAEMVDAVQDSMFVDMEAEGADLSEDKLNMVDKARKFALKESAGNAYSLGLSTRTTIAETQKDSLDGIEDARKGSDGVMGDIGANTDAMIYMVNQLAVMQEITANQLELTATRAMQGDTY